MRTRIRACLSLLLLAAPLKAGVMSDFGPFPDSETVPRVALASCPLVRSASEGTKTVDEFAMPAEPDRPVLTITTEQPGSERADSRLRLDFGGKSISYETTLPGAEGFEQVYTADLNQDRIPDFVLPFVRPRAADRGSDDPSGDRGSLLFILSGKERYRFTRVDDARFDEEGFLSILNDGAVQWVHTALIARHPARLKSKNGKGYFYLHRLYYVRGDRLVEVDGMDARFPKFVLYVPGTARKNHKETKLLTADQKKEILASRPVTLLELEVKVTTPRPATSLRKIRSAGRGGR